MCGLNDLKTLLKHTIQSNVYQEFSLTQTTTVKAQYRTTLWVNTTGNQLSEPHDDHGPPSQQKQPLCGNTQQLCGIFDLKHHWKTIFRAPCSPGPTPHNTNNHFLGTHNHNTNNNCVSTYNQFVGKFTSNYRWKPTFRAPCSPGSAPP